MFYAAISLRFLMPPVFFIRAKAADADAYACYAPYAAAKAAARQAHTYSGGADAAPYDMLCRARAASCAICVRASAQRSAARYVLREDAQWRVRERKAARPCLMSVATRRHYFDAGYAASRLRCYGDSVMLLRQPLYYVAAITLFSPLRAFDTALLCQLRHADTLCAALICRRCCRAARVLRCAIAAYF